MHECESRKLTARREIFETKYNGELQRLMDLRNEIDQANAVRR